MKIAIIGGGSAGVWTALHYGFFTRNDKNIEVELLYDPEIDSFPVGQGTVPEVASLLWAACGTDWYHNEIRATPKLGILYENFSRENTNIYHPFHLNSIALQSDPKYLQKYILNSGLFAVKEEHVTDLETVDADVIFDCRGNVNTEDIEYAPLYIPVNSVLLATSTMNDNTQNWTRSVATPDGWTFVIPNTTNTTSYGYLYNKDITPLETAKTNFSELFGKEFPNEIKAANLPFESYRAIESIRIDSNGRKIILNGNRLAFLEPLEATAIGFYLDVAKFTFNWVVGQMDIHEMNNVSASINNQIHELHTFILWHYIRGSVYDTPFWEIAQAKTTAIFEQPNEQFQQTVNLVKSLEYIDCRVSSHSPYGQWPMYSIKIWYDNYIK